MDTPTSFAQPRVSNPVAVTMPAHGVVFAESVHESDFRMTRRSDPFHKIIYVLQGAIAFSETRRKTEIEGGPGTFFAVSSKVSHVIRDISPPTLLLLCLSPAFVKQTNERSLLWRVVAGMNGRSIHFDRTLCQRFENLWRHSLVEQSHLQIGSSEILSNHATQVLVSIARLPAANSPDLSHQRIGSLVRELEETFYDEWNIDRASARAGLSRRHFCQLFREITGMTFLEKLVDCRLSHAARLLAQGGHSITGVAFSSGFQDLSHFYRVFRQHHGMSPGKWIAKHLTRT